MLAGMAKRESMGLEINPPTSPPEPVNKISTRESEARKKSKPPTV